MKLRWAEEPLTKGTSTEAAGLAEYRGLRVFCGRVSTVLEVNARLAANKSNAFESIAKRTQSRLYLVIGKVVKWS